MAGMFLVPLLSSFGLIALAELGDKSQLMVINLCTKHRPRNVFLSSFLALVGVGGISVFFGSALSHFLPMFWIKTGSGIAFIIFGVHSLLGEEGSLSGEKTSVLSSFSMIALLELGDKTQLATIALSAQFGSPFLVFLGVGLAFLFITGLGILIGVKLRDLLPEEYLKILSSIIFLGFGIMSLIGILTGINTL